MGKFYAVKNGYHIGIFNSWEECQKEVSGYSGAEFKSFASRRDAEEYMGVNSQLSLFDEADSSTAVAYVDGSYNVTTQKFGCGVVIFYNGAEHTFSECFDDAEMAQMRNVAGEIEGAKRAMRWCAENSVDELDIYYDYEGVEKWCTGEWKTNKSGTAAYKKFYDEMSKTISISFNKVRGHSGDRFNDMADLLAKKAVGIE